MCGITGIINLNQTKPDRQLLTKMTSAIAYRGPDDQGIEIIGRCGLGNRRLKVIDLSRAAHMPLWDTSHQYCITYNGEIYNYRQLKKELIKKGQRFFSKSDTEVILNLYKVYGVNGIKKLRGMFAFAIWDSLKQELILARDQFGIKPLHYFFNDKVFLFASEIKSLLIHPAVKIAINPVGLSQYFSLGFGCTSAPQTIYQDIYQLEPGQIGILRAKKLDIKSYFDVAEIKQSAITFPRAVSRTKKLLEQSVKDQLVADVPLGVFLSGGLDSSLIAYYAQKHTANKIKTFSIGFEDSKFDESQYSTQMAEFLNTDHHHQQFTVKDLLNSLPSVIEKLDEPFGDTSILPTYLLSKFTREQVTVALSGDGADELFIGYPTFIAHYFSYLIKYWPTEIRSLFEQGCGQLSGLLNLLPFFRHSPNFSSQFKLQRFFKGSDKNLVKEHLNFLGSFNFQDKEQLLISSQDYTLPLAQELAGKIQRDWQTKLQYLDLKIYLGDNCLTKTDRASSFNSLEVRVPFLNQELAQLAFSLPFGYKQHGLTLKYLLKEAAAGLLPENIINRPKKGFGLPVHQWLNGPLNKQMRSLLAKNKIRKQGLFNADFVTSLIKQHESGRVDRRTELWSLFMFQLWYEKWMKKS